MWPGLSRYPGEAKVILLEVGNATHYLWAHFIFGEFPDFWEFVLQKWKSETLLTSSIWGSRIQVLPIRPIWLRPPCWSEWGTSQNPSWQIEGEAPPSRDVARGSSRSFQYSPLGAKAGLSVPRHSSNRVPPGTTLLCNFHMAPSLRAATVYSLALTEIPRTLKIFNTIPFSA